MTQDIQAICAGLLFGTIALYLIWVTIRGLTAKGLNDSPPYLPDALEDDYIPNKHERTHWDDFVIKRAGDLLEARRSGRWDGPPVTVRWDRSKAPEGTISGNIAKWIEDEGERHNVHVQRV